MITKEEKIGERIKRLRIAAGLSQRQCQSIGVSYAYISRIEAGARRPSTQVLVEIADALNETHKLPFVVTALYLMTGEFDSPCPLCKRGAFDGD